MSDYTLASTEPSSGGFESSIDPTVNLIVSACQEAKGRDILVLDMKGISDLTGHFVIVSGRSDRQVQGIANRVLDTLAKHGIRPNAFEGFEIGQWIVLDFGTVLVHAFYHEARDLYDLEGFWHRAKRQKIASDSISADLGQRDWGNTEAA